MFGLIDRNVSTVSAEWLKPWPAVGEPQRRSLFETPRASPHGHSWCLPLELTFSGVNISLEPRHPSDAHRQPHTAFINVDSWLGLARSGCLLYWLLARKPHCFPLHCDRISVTLSDGFRG